MATQSVRIGWRPYVNQAVASVWNLLNAVYSADTTASPSLKASLYAAYNGESNANDSFGTNNGTAVGGLTYGTGKIGNAFSFNGSNSYVKLTTDTMKFAGDFSISAWCYFSGASANTQTIFSNLTYDGTYGYGYYLYYMNNTLTFQINNSLPFASGGNVQLNYVVNIFNGWHLVTVTRKSSTGTKMYLNGNLVANNTSTYNPNYHSNMIPSIGSTDYGTTYNGLVSYYSNSGTKIDALNIWSKELTASEVSELYNSGNGAQYITNDFYKPTTNNALNTNNGTAVGGLTYGLGKVGTAFVFNGSNSFINLPTSSMNLTGDFTIAFWLYHTASGAQTLISNLYYQATPTNIYKGWGLYIDNLSSSTNKLGFIIPRQTTDYVGFEFNTPLTLNAWNHVIITRVSGVDTYAWINNTLSTTTYTGPLNSGNKIIDPSYYTTQRVSIGAQNGSGTPATFMSVNSKIDGLTIWNKQLTADERTQIYNSGNGKQYPN